jgi:hypothetical protein
MKPTLIAAILLAGACSSPAQVTTTAAPGTAGATTPTPATTSTLPIVTVDATFAISKVVFGDAGRIEVVNTGPQAGNIHGHWIAVHPFYLEMPSMIVESGKTVVISLDQEQQRDDWVNAYGLLPILAALGGEVGLYANGQFGDPTAIVDYVEWGSPGHFRSTVAMAAGIWDDSRIVPMAGNEAGLMKSGEEDGGFRSVSEEELS